MLDRGVVAPLDEGTTLLLADPSLVAASIVARLPETLCCCCPPVVPTKKIDSKPQRYHRRASRRSACDVTKLACGLIEPELR